jgi:hypothetical protein
MERRCPDDLGTHDLLTGLAGAATMREEHHRE